MGFYCCGFLLLGTNPAVQVDQWLYLGPEGAWIGNELPPTGPSGFPFDPEGCYAGVRAGTHPPCMQP